MLNVFPGMLEKDFQAEVIKFAESQGWEHIYHTYDSRKCTPGFADLIMLKGNYANIIELKRDSKQKPSDAQQSWMDAWDKVTVKNIDLWTPEMSEEIVKILMEKGR